MLMIATRAIALALLVLWTLAGHAAPALYFPTDSWERTTPVAAGWDPARIAAALDYARSKRSTGVVILSRGRIMAEAYWPVEPHSETALWAQTVAAVGANGETVEDVASVQKSVVSFLFGAARDRGILRWETPVSDFLGPGWSRSDPATEREITVYHLLSMTSGLAQDLSFRAAPGAEWRYNSTAYSLLIDVLESASGRSIYECTRAWLTRPIGMASSDWTPRGKLPPGLDANRLGFRSTARDLARFGLMILANGHWRDRMLIDPNYFVDALRPSQDFKPRYGLLWWLNVDNREGTQLVATAPSDMVVAIGAFGRRVFIVPSLNLVVTRLGDGPGPDFDTEFWRVLTTGSATVPSQTGASR